MQACTAALIAATSGGCFGACVSDHTIAVDPLCCCLLCHAVLTITACNRDMIDGMRMDLVKSRYDTYDELYEYCYRVAGTVALMSMPVMGVDPAYKVRRAGCRGV